MNESDTRRVIERLFCLFLHRCKRPENLPRSRDAIYNDDCERAVLMLLGDKFGKLFRVGRLGCRGKRHRTWSDALFSLEQFFRPATGLFGAAEFFNEPATSGLRMIHSS